LFFFHVVVEFEGKGLVLLESFLLIF